MSCSAQAMALSNQAHYPEGLVKRILPKPLSVLAGIVSGFIKTIIFPVTTLLCTVGFTGKAIYECAKGRNGSSYATAALLNFAGLAATVAFLGAAAFYLPFEMTCALLLSAVTVSVIFHVIKAVEG